MNTHVEMLVARIMYAESFGQLLRGMRRSREIAIKHGLSWPMVRDAGYGAARAARARKARPAMHGGLAV